MNALAAVSDGNQRGAHILARSGRSDSARAFRAAVRHSRHVRILRIVVPLSVVAVVVVVVVLVGIPIETSTLIVTPGKTSFPAGGSVPITRPGG
jgi:hypothetical protein